MDYLTGWRIPGCGCIVYHKGKPVFKYSAGYADMENNIKLDCDRHRMFMYSISKIITCATALTLWEEGKFLLDDPVGEFLPSWKEARVRAKDGEGKLLIIDDLGTEMQTQFTVPCLYNLINTRLISEKSMIISTNVKKEELLTKYSDRITSRMFGEFEICVFKGKDIRSQKLMKKIK